MWQTGIYEIKSEPALLSLSGIKTAWKRPVQARTGSSRLLKITTCEKSVYFIRLHFPRATQHPGSTPPTGPSLHFSPDLHLIPPCRTRLDSTWVLLGLWPKSRVSLATPPPPALGRRPGVGFPLLGASPSCLNLTDFLILKAASDPDSTTSFMFVPGFFLFLRTPKQEQSFRDRRLYMLVRLLQDQCRDFAVGPVKAVTSTILPLAFTRRAVADFSGDPVCYLMSRKEPPAAWR